MKKPVGILLNIPQRGKRASRKVKASRNEAGLTDTVVIVFVIFAVIGLVSSYILSGSVILVQEKIKAADSERKEIDAEAKIIQEHIVSVSPFVTQIAGYGEQVEPEKIRAFLDEKIKTYKLASNIERTAEIGGEDLTLEYIVNLLSQNVTSTEMGKKLVEYGKNSSRERGAVFNEAKTNIEDIKNREIQEIRRMLNDLAATESKEESSYQSRVNELTGKRSTLDTEKQSKEDKNKEQKTELEFKINKVKQEIEFLAYREIIKRDIIETQGAIIKPVVKEGFAFINLGSNDGVMLGLKFRVFRKDKNGTRKWKGQVEVKKIFDTYSLVSVTGVVNPVDPIVEGDYITNVFFSKGKEKSIALVGDIDQSNFRYSRTEIEKRLSDIGVKVEQSVSVRTDFVILGKNYEGLEAFNTIRILNIPCLEDKEASESVEFCLGD
jgi:hypothetical protein